MSEEVVTAQTQVGQLEKQLTEARATMEKYLRDYDTLYTRTQKLTEDLEEQMEKTGTVHGELVSSQKECKLQRDECTRMSTEKNQMERKVEREHKAAMRYRQLFDESKTPLTMAQQEVQSLNKELEVRKRNAHAHAAPKTPPLTSPTFGARRRSLCSLMCVANILPPRSTRGGRTRPGRRWTCSSATRTCS